MPFIQCHPKFTGLPWWYSGWDSTVPLQGVWVWSLVEQLRSHVSCSKKKKKKTHTHTIYSADQGNREPWPKDDILSYKCAGICRSGIEFCRCENSEAPEGWVWTSLWRWNLGMDPRSAGMAVGGGPVGSLTDLWVGDSERWELHWKQVLPSTASGQEQGWDFSDPRPRSLVSIKSNFCHNPFNKYLLSAYSLPDPVLGSAEDSAITETTLAVPS